VDQSARPRLSFSAGLPARSGSSRRRPRRRSSVVPADVGARPFQPWRSTRATRRGATRRDMASLVAEHTPRAVSRRLGQRPSPSHLHDFIYTSWASQSFETIRGSRRRGRVEDAFRPEPGGARPCTPRSPKATMSVQGSLGAQGRRLPGTRARRCRRRTAPLGRRLRAASGAAFGRAGPGCAASSARPRARRCVEAAVAG
jgi:hypothetical protein